ncbi:galactose mutarotase [Cyanobium sp. CH-040]|uniref:aldose epimerase family protein n=1 Tax=Cyanobium sp. CH-040 TaxID=2823708 RepID=UPI0020CDD12C|nr:galactose mutarotase [Cyanobium sp. CH-040]MCP9926942.1 galactose mutarotase [Cyanobium sp. CH-040]
MVLVQRDAPYPHVEFRDSLDGDLLRVVPERGGLITGWRCGGRERLYFDQERFRDPALSVRGGMPVLFPICGGLPGGVLSLPEGSFQLPQHGFARDLPWQLRPLADGRGIALELEHNATTLALYPFRFLLRLEVRLAPGTLEIAATVHNRGEAPMPFSLGLHPYFCITDLATARFEGLPPRCVDQLTGQECDTDQQIDLMAEGIDLLAQPAGPVRLVDPSAGTTLELQPSAPLDRVVIWSDPPRPMVCLEPWTAPRGALVSGEGRLEVLPGSQIQLHSRYRAVA